MLDTLVVLQQQNKLSKDYKEYVLNRKVDALVFCEIKNLHHEELLTLMYVLEVKIGYDGYPVEAMDEDELRTQVVLELRKKQKRKKIIARRNKKRKQSQLNRFKNKLIVMLGVN